VDLVPAGVEEVAEAVDRVGEAVVVLAGDVADQCLEPSDLFVQGPLVPDRVEQALESV
jgi:hypothetical protein